MVEAGESEMVRVRTDFNRCTVLRMSTHVVKFDELNWHICHLVERGLGAFVCLANVHMCIESFDDANFQTIVNSADLVLADGKPIWLAQRLSGFKEGQHIRGRNFADYLCELSQAHGWSIGLYGGACVDTLNLAAAGFQKAFPGLRIGYRGCPPWRPLSEQERARLIEEINASGISVLFIGLGCPKQERLMFEIKDSIKCLMVGVGAVFDFAAGTKIEAPVWMQKAGLEWLWRLASEPKRLWRRYLIYNSRFIFHFLKAKLFRS